MTGDTHQSRGTSLNAGIKKNEREKSALSDIVVNISLAYSILSITGSKEAELGEERAGIKHPGDIKMK